MTSAIDPNHPEDGIAVSKAEARANWTAAKTELEHGGFAQGLIPTNYTASSSRVIDHLAGIDTALGAGGGAAFTALADTPGTYQGQANRYPRVKADESGLEFVEQAAGGDASTTSYVAAGTGATTRTVRDKLGEVVSVKDFGAKGDGVADDSSAFVAAIAWAEAQVQSGPIGVDPTGRVTIYLPTGRYRITQAEALIRPTWTNGFNKAAGLHFRGAGSQATHILFQPSSAANLAHNQRWLWVRFSGMTISCLTSGSKFLLSAEQNDTTNVQDYYFDDVWWTGAWANVIHLTGVNNNSEWTFLHCGANVVGKMTGPFLWSETSDQFLNFWFYSFQYWDATQPLVRMTKGGHVKLVNCDFSNWCHGVSAQRFLIELLGTSHHRGVCQFEARGTRVEAKGVGGASQAAFLYSEWPHGEIVVDGFDWSSQQPFYTHGDVFVLRPDNTAGATFRLANAQMAGTIRVRYGTEGFRREHRMLIEHCTWLDRKLPQDVIVYEALAGHGNTGSRPIVRFRHCRGEVAKDTFDKPVWDCEIGNDQARATLREYCASIRGVWGGLPHTTDDYFISLPVGAIVTKVISFASAGQNGATMAGGWTVRTTEVTPETVAAISVSNPSLGWNITATPSPLFLCDTAAKAKLIIEAIGSAAGSTSFTGRLLVFYLA